MVDQAEIHRKVASGDVEERKDGVEQLCSNFADLPDKDEAWKDLIRLTGDKDSNVCLCVANALGFVFQHVPDKNAAWKELIRLTGDKDNNVCLCAANALGSAFPHVPDKDAAWEDLIRLTGDKYSNVRWGAANVLGSTFQHVPDKDAAWKDLIRLTEDEDDGVWWHATYALGSAFQHVPDKEEAWKDLHQLTEDEDSDVRRHAADALGSAFQHVPDKDEAWKDLHRLTGDEDISVRVSANHSLGRTSIFKATEAESEDDFESELNNAIDFFERSSNEVTYSNPSSFCLPFYRSFFMIAFEKTESKGEVQRYLAEAKSASKGSKNKETLLEAVENLASALTEAHKTRDFGAMKSDLNACMQYCNRAADLIDDAAEDAPGAAGILRRGIPIIGERIRDIQAKAKALCRETRGKGAPYEPLGMEVNKWARDLSDRGYLQDEKDVPRIRDLLGKLCNLISEDERDYPCKIVEEIREERKPEDNLSDIITALSYLVPSIKSQLQNAAKPMTDETRSDEQPSQKTGHSTTVFAGDGSNVTVTQTETESGDVTVNTEVTKESQPYKQPDRSSKRTAIEISADIAVHVLVYTVLHHFAEDLMPVIAPILVITALITLILIIRNAKSG